MHEPEYNDLMALNNIVILATVAEKPKPCSRSRVVCQRVLEYAVVAAVVAAIEYGFTAHNSRDGVKSYLAVNGSAPSNGTVPVPQGLHQVLTTEAPNLVNRLPMGQWVKQESYRAPNAVCVDMFYNRAKTDVKVRELMLTDHELCGRENNGTLMCQNLMVRNPQ
ncbi:hypothetical protein GNI_119800 [Gregarina niphandrodes]|uniref:Uncharacterized protein n=1 Tax=Gregarina niphandrodes TaxID=110365 RepID=A0A023B2M0_GRENI|nr:hypothetical protein GNI_119800 [Gregarina niphandrodes]EZG54810.1 hypothetical protein GNI_119800 [Gregarina niphandrodes]|eukprot:XP_011131824.1 hypothetical protein GNI_119800 [Gregarina niphandrodes]